ncbi:spermatogenesis-associated protein 1 [Clarias gariepinus]|uniref:spermatogenesis-associated protein 1 n=1 Tax=Clarias gariepinus TaxID=13013 RepID=UPI00234E2D29|nr:spermatogenesis-associated protein 1 [Clarias gariepinus]
MRERATASECVELHVFFVPDEQWNSRLNKVSVEAIDSFISGGFIRVHPDKSLKAIREELGSLLLRSEVMDRYYFLKCVGRSLAMVKAKQEKDLKAKSFAPPYSPYPELYLLPVKENFNSHCSRSLSSGTVLYNTDSQTCYPPRPIFAPGQTKEPTKFPLIKQGPQQYVLARSLGNESSSSSLEGREQDTPGCEYSQLHVDRAETIAPVLCDSTPRALSQPLHEQKTTPELSSNRDDLLKEIRLVKEERKKLEKTRQELLRKGKELLALNRHYRNQARDKWKRRYFDTKKSTAPLEETLKRLRQELETFYNKLVQQLQARDGRNKQRRAGKLSSTKNDLIIQIMTESCEIDNLKKNIDDAKMKLDTEIKLRIQAAMELQSLKAELMQKKSQCSFAGSFTGSADLG